MRSILRFLTLGILCAAGAFGQQGSFAQIAYGGSWQTTFTLLNLSSTDLGSVTLSFFGDDGLPLSAPVQGFGNATSYTVAIPQGGATNVVLSGSGATTIQGWASMTVTSGVVRGQGSFRFQLPGGPLWEAVVPLSTPNTALCIFPFPPSPNPVILIPFDNTSGQYVTSLAIANTTGASLPVPIEFDDQSNNPLVTDTLNLTAMQHLAFRTIDRYPQQLAGKKGILRIHASATSVSVLGLLSNITNSSNAITTIIPVTQ